MPKEIHISVLEFPPIVDSRLPGTGFTGALFREIFVPQGYEPVIEVVPWARAFENGKVGVTDAVWPSIQTQARAEWFLFTQPAVQTRYYLLARRDRHLQFRTVEDLKSWTIGVLRGGSTGSFLDTEPGLTFETATDFRSNLFKVLSGRIDAMTAEVHHLRLLLKTEFRDRANEVEFLEPALSITDLHLMVSKKTVGAEQLVQAFDQGLAALKRSGRYQQLLETYGLED